jgi:hypothetical protein
MSFRIRLLVLAACVATGVQAQIKAQHFPADAKWVLHLDLKALNQSPMGQFVRQAMDEEAHRGLASLKAMSGIDLTNDVDSLVVCGKGDAQAGGVMYVYGRFDIQKLTAIAGGAKEFQNKAFGERSLLSWQDKGKRNNLCFIDPTLAVMSQDEQLVQEAVKTIDGQVAGMGKEGPFGHVLTHSKDRFFALQANNLSAFAGANPQLQLFKQAEAVMLEVGQMAGANGLDCALAIKAATPELAQQMNQAAMGLQALFQLQAAQNPEAAAIAQGVKVGLQDTIVTVNLKLTEDVLKKQIQVRVEQRKAAQAARVAARQAAREAAAAGAKKPERQEF